MRRHKIVIRRARRGLDVSFKTLRLLRDCIVLALTAERFPFDAELSVLLTDNAGIRRYNRVHRSVDAATDVLSFPLLDFRDGTGTVEPADIDPGSGRVALGDIVISLERAREQAAAYGHSLRRECAFLTLHGLLHLLGYDHEDGEARRLRMRRREEAVLRWMDLGRGEADE